MPLFASFDSIYTEPTSDALPEFSLTLHEQNPNSIHDKLIDFDTSGIPEIILATEPDSYNPINPFDYIQPDIDPGDNLHGNRSNWDVICDVGTALKQTSAADALTNYRPEAIGLDYPIFDVVNKVVSSLQPANEFI